MNSNFKKVAFVLIAGVSAASAFAGATSAKGSFVDTNGNRVGPVVNLPDCRSCKVTQTGPNRYVIKIPNDVRAKLGMPKK